MIDDDLRQRIAAMREGNEAGLGSARRDIEPGGDDHPYLSDENLKWLAASGVTEDHARRRGYRTVHSCNPQDREMRLKMGSPLPEGQDMLEEAGFTKRQCSRVEHEPGLLIPLLDKRGDRWGWQLRNFIEDNGLDSLWARYHSPQGQSPRIDVPPGCGPMLDDPDEPLWLTEGTKKADCAYLHGLCCVALLGVWGWVARNEHDGVTTLADWEEIPFSNRRTGKGRKVVVAFDSDIMCKQGVRQATFRLCCWLQHRKADPHICWLPDGKDKVGIDDYLMGKG